MGSDMEISPGRMVSLLQPGDDGERRDRHHRPPRHGQRRPGTPADRGAAGRPSHTMAASLREVAMPANAALIERFYRAFGARDADGVVACYHPDVEFSDPVFPDLRGDRARAMWRMLILRGKDLRVEARDFAADDRAGSAHWDAWYTFSATGRPVHNSIDARFTFQDGLIRTHRDTFDLWRWSAQALGAKGSLLGWSGFVQGAIRKQAARALDDFIAKQG